MPEKKYRARKKRWSNRAKRGWPKIWQWAVVTSAQPEIFEKSRICLVVFFRTFFLQFSFGRISAGNQYIFFNEFIRTLPTKRMRHVSPVLEAFKGCALAAHWSPQLCTFFPPVTALPPPIANQVQNHAHMQCSWTKLFIWQSSTRWNNVESAMNQYDSKLLQWS